MKKRKAQASLEYLSTYAWAFLITLTMIGSLSYFGALDVGKFVPERCVLTFGFSCIDYVHKIDGGVSVFKVQMINSQTTPIQIDTYKDVATLQRYVRLNKDDCAITNLTINTGSGAISLVSSLGFNGTSAPEFNSLITIAASKSAELSFICDQMLVPGYKPRLSAKLFYREEGKEFARDLKVLLSTST